MQCNKCGRDAVFYQEYSGQHFCERHVEAYVEAKAKYEIRRNKWIQPEDHVAVAFSGNASSSALLYFLKNLTSNRRDVKISAILLDEGISGFHDLKNSLRITGMPDTDCITGSFQQSFGITLDEIACRKGTAVSCTYCRVLRNFLLNRIAVEHGITKLAFGDTLDDAAARVLKNVLRGTPEIFVHSELCKGGMVPRIRPFIAVPYNEVALYADLHNLKYEKSPCPYRNNGFEKDVQTLLDGFTGKHPATKYALRNLGKHLTGACSSMADAVSTCEQCGEPKDGICQYCRIVSEVTACGD